jgi:uncharacterized membrane protein YdbT with pleckstrin-like domain
VSSSIYLSTYLSMILANNIRLADVEIIDDSEEVEEDDDEEEEEDEDEGAVESVQIRTGGRAEGVGVAKTGKGLGVEEESIGPVMCSVRENYPYFYIETICEPSCSCCLMLCWAVCVCVCVCV